MKVKTYYYRVAQMCMLSNETVQLIDQLAVAQQERKKKMIILPSIPCLWQPGDPKTLKAIDWIAIKDNIISRKLI